ncbi:MAG TPA: acetoacetate--CoA ligase [Candidatus Acidoferrales bacterium]|nr:acetoacetate--CoA ligase [Candidatus Acidoferrales bacterium]
MSGDPAVLWKPSLERIAAANLTRFIKAAEAVSGLHFADYAAVWRWSVDCPAAFWRLVWTFCGVIGDGPGDVALERPGEMPGARFFPHAKLNFAENLLRHSDSSDALVFWGEERVRRRMSWSALHASVSQLQQALKAEGVKPGDRVTAILPNMPEAIIAMLAATSLGAIWSSCSPDFGVQGVLDRFGQIQPKVLLAVDGSFYNGKTLDALGKLPEIVSRLPSLSRVIVVPYVSEKPALPDIPRAVLFADYVASHKPRTVEYTRLPFNHPLYILFSSGTTGAPKCIVHGAGGTLLQHLKEHQLHCDIKPGDRVFYFTTCSWMMWNWLASALASEATLLLYDGSPMHPSGRVLFDLADAEGMTLFGTSAKFIDACSKAGLEPAKTHRLDSVCTVTSTGSPLVAESFHYVYRAIKQDVHLASISGGTDIVSCFVLGNPIAPVYRGEIQARGLGMAVDVFDDRGKPLHGAKGELVCVKPFPSMPVGFWNDPEARKYHAAYFERFPGVWCHGDWTELTPRDGVIIFGRSDAVLNPGGVRIGTAEIYRQVEQVPEVLESIVIAQDWDNDVRVVLFVRLRDSLTLTPEIERKIIEQIRMNATPRHVPAKILQVDDIPRTKSGKIVEMAVRDVVHGRPVKQLDALANPESLDLYKDLAELK